MKKSNKTTKYNKKINYINLIDSVDLVHNQLNGSVQVIQLN